MRKIIVFAVLLPALLLLSCADGASPSACADGWKELPLPAVCVYRSGAYEWEEERLPDSICEMFFGDAVPEEYLLILSAEPGEVCELLCARTRGEREAEALARRMGARLAYVTKNADAAVRDSLSPSSVRVRGRCVFYAASPLAAEAERIWERA